MPQASPFGPLRLAADCVLGSTENRISGSNPSFSAKCRRLRAGTEIRRRRRTSSSIISRVAITGSGFPARLIQRQCARRGRGRLQSERSARHCSGEPQRYRSTLAERQRQRRPLAQGQTAAAGAEPRRDAFSLSRTNWAAGPFARNCRSRRIPALRITVEQPVAKNARGRLPTIRCCQLGRCVPDALSGSGGGGFAFGISGLIPKIPQTAGPRIMLA